MHVRLFLNSMGCSQKCDYCYIRHMKGVAEDQTETTLDKEAIKKEIEKIDNVEGIAIWGGEPLENFDRFKEAMDFMISLAPYAQRSVITNGEALNNDAVIKYLVDNGISPHVSYDGPDAHKASNRKDIFTDPSYYKNLAKIRLHINTVLHKRTLNLPDIFSKIMANKAIVLSSWNFVPFHATDEHTLSYLPNTEELITMREGIDKMIKFALADSKILGPVRQRIVHIRNLINSKPGYNCDTHDRIYLTNTGKQVLCHVHGEFQDLPIQFERGESREMCSGCNVENVCRGICPLMGNEYSKLNCEYAKAFYGQLAETITKNDAVR